MHTYNCIECGLACTHVLISPWIPLAGDSIFVTHVFYLTISLLWVIQLVFIKYWNFSVILLICGDNGSEYLKLRLSQKKRPMVQERSRRPSAGGKAEQKAGPEQARCSRQVKTGDSSDHHHQGYSSGLCTMPRNHSKGFLCMISSNTHKSPDRSLYEPCFIAEEMGWERSLGTVRAGIQTQGFPTP